MKFRRFGYALIALLVLLVVADVAYWNLAANRMRDGIRAWTADRTAEGWRIHTGPMTIGGWPNTVVARLPDVVMTHDPTDQPGAFPVPVRFASGAVSVLVSLFQPTTLTLALQGDQRIEMAGSPPLLVAGEALDVRLPLTSPTDREITFSGRDVRVQPAAKTWMARIETIDGTASLADTEAGAAAIDFTCSAETINLPTGFKYPLGPSITELSVGGTLNGPFPPGGALAASASAWRDGGGSLEVKEAVLDWGPLTLTSTATLALDDQLQPMGSGSAKVSGYQDALDHLAAAGVLTKSAATVAKAMLSLLAGTGTGDAPSEVEVPLTLQYRTLSMRQVPLVRLPELDWPAP
jgi:hypothetical protein